MPKLSVSVPHYGRHKVSDQAIVRLQGRDIYLGKYGSAASHEAYKGFVTEWSRNGGKLPAATYLATFTEIIIAYIEFANRYFRKYGNGLLTGSALDRLTQYCHILKTMG